jgi:hypothetical protein
MRNESDDQRDHYCHEHRYRAFRDRICRWLHVLQGDNGTARTENRRPHVASGIANAPPIGRAGTAFTEISIRAAAAAAGKARATAASSCGENHRAASRYPLGRRMTVSSNDEQLIRLFKIVVARLVGIAMAESEVEENLVKTLLAETLLLSATLHHASGGSEASFLVMAKDSIELMQTSGATKQ